VTSLNEAVRPVTPLPQVLVNLDLSVDALTELTGLDKNTVIRAVYGSHRRTNIKTARIIAETLGYEMDMISWPAGLTKIGRSPLTGHPFTVKNKGSAIVSTDPFNNNDIFKDNDLVFSPEKKRLVFEDKFCSVPGHNLVLPLTGECDMCT